jgi:RecJ-like exonuclease
MSSAPSTIERMSAYQRATGLKPAGVHRPVADKLLKNVSHRCVQCGGHGYIEVRAAWIWCEVCGGLGRVMTPKAQMQLRGRVEARFPDAAAVPAAVLLLD